MTKYVTIRVRVEGFLMTVLSEKLTELREKRGWTKTNVAKKLGIKTMSTYANWEYGLREPDHATLLNIADMYEVSVDYLLGKVVDEYDPLSEVNQLVKDYGIERMGFFDMEKWKKFTPEDVEDVRKHFEWVVHKVMEREKNK